MADPEKWREVVNGAWEPGHLEEVQSLIEEEMDIYDRIWERGEIGAVEFLREKRRELKTLWEGSQEESSRRGTKGQKIRNCGRKIATKATQSLVFG